MYVVIDNIIWLLMNIDFLEQRYGHLYFRTGSLLTRLYFTRRLDRVFRKVLKTHSKRCRPMVHSIVDQSNADILLPSRLGKQDHMIKTSCKNIETVLNYARRILC